MTRRNHFVIHRRAMAAYRNQRVTVTATLQRHASRKSRSGRVGTICLEHVYIGDHYVADHVWIDAPNGSHTLRPGTPLCLTATVGEYGRPGRRDYALVDVELFV